MKKKIIFGTLGVILISINLTQTFQIQDGALRLSHLVNIVRANPEDPDEWVQTATDYDVSCKWCYDYGWPAGKLESTCDCIETQYRCYKIPEGDPTCTESFELTLVGNCTPIDGGMWSC